MKSNIAEMLKPMELPQGGPLAISPEVAALFLAHIEMLTTVGNDPGTDARFARAAANRDTLLANMTQSQRENAAMIASTVGRLVA